jgi:hypothetical protein
MTTRQKIYTALILFMGIFVVELIQVAPFAAGYKGPHEGPILLIMLAWGYYVGKQDGKKNENVI